MRVIKRAIAVFLLLIGIPITVAIGFELGDPDEDRDDKEDAVAALFLFGLPAVVGGGWLWRGTQHQSQKEYRDRLQSAFFELLKINDGKITVLNFAMQAKITGDEAKAFLDERAKEFGVSFDVNEQGGIFYCFDLGQEMKPLVASAQPAMFDIILDQVPEYSQIQAVQIIKELSNLDSQIIAQHLENLPQTIQRNVSQEVAELYKRRLEAVGVNVMIVLS